MIYDQVHNALFHQKLESLQCNACLATTRAICGSSRENLCQELGFESLQQRCWYRKLCSFYKVFKNQSPRYLFKIIPIRNPACSTRNHVNIPLFKTNQNFFPSTIIEWNNFDPNLILRYLWNPDTYGAFKSTILKFIRPSPNSVFECRNSQGIKLQTRLRLGLSHSSIVFINKFST